MSYNRNIINQGRIIMAEIYLRRAQLQDLPAIMKIIDDAKELLKKNGSPQWQNGYPNQETLTQDIAMQTNWVLINDNKVAATATFTATLPRDSGNNQMSLMLPSTGSLSAVIIGAKDLVNCYFLTC